MSEEDHTEKKPTEIDRESAAGSIRKNNPDLLQRSIGSIRSIVNQLTDDCSVDELSTLEYFWREMLDVITKNKNITEIQLGLQASLDQDVQIQTGQITFPVAMMNIPIDTETDSASNPSDIFIPHPEKGPPTDPPTPSEESVSTEFSAASPETPGPTSENAESPDNDDLPITHFPIIDKQPVQANRAVIRMPQHAQDKDYYTLFGVGNEITLDITKKCERCDFKANCNACRGNGVYAKVKLLLFDSNVVDMKIWPEELARLLNVPRNNLTDSFLNKKILLEKAFSNLYRGRLWQCLVQYKTWNGELGVNASKVIVKPWNIFRSFLEGTGEYDPGDTHNKTKIE